MQGYVTKAGAGGDGDLGGRMCVFIEDVCHQVKELYEEIYRLHSIRDKKRSLMRSSLRPCGCKSLNSKRRSRQNHWCQRTPDGEGCKILTFGIRQMAPALSAGLQLQKKFSVLVRQGTESCA